MRFKYKTDSKREEHLGFIAEDVPDLVSTQERKALCTMGLTAVLTKVAQEQQRENQEQDKEIQEQREMLKEQQAITSDLLREMKEIKNRI